MGFGLNTKIEAPKVEVPKVEVPKADVAGAASVSAGGGGGAGLAGGLGGGLGAGLGAAAAGAAGALTGAVKGVAGAAAGAAGGITGAVAGAVGGAVSLASVAGALGEVSVSFQGGTEDAAMEPHMVLDANADYEETKFEKGPIWVRVDLTPEKAKASGDILHLRSEAGDYDRRQPISAFSESGPNTVDVLFEEAPMDQAYSLEIVGEDGRAYPIFTQVLYGDLRKTKNRF